jgi:hypothetical protein
MYQTLMVKKLVEQGEYISKTIAATLPAAGGLEAYTYFHEAMPPAISSEDVER